MAQASFVQEGNLITYVNAGSAISYKDIIVYGGRVLIAAEDIAATTGQGSAYAEGVFAFPAGSSDTYSQGDLVYWDAADGEVNTDTTNPVVGRVVKAKVNGETTVNVKLMEGDSDAAAVALIGDISDLDTEDQTTLVDAINELHTEIGNSVDYIADDSTLTLGEATTTQTITIQLKDSAGVNIAAVQKIRGYMCTDSAGATPSVSGCGTSVTATTGAILKAITAKLDFDILTDATGKAVLVFNNGSGGGTYTDRFALVLPCGKLVVSDALAVLNA